MFHAMPASQKVLVELVGAQARPFTLRLDAARRAKLDEVAHERHTTPSQLMRELIDSF
ncbi:hypothetical protein GCM10022287_13730 [Gryllotalpicola koreensis]|uniref:Ribbon-helix-helix protein, CopG family n=1 Tax=Gryllotalpicola koreensis TaxID=993086 RepID=A0ABP7ZX74_9MICO